MPVRGALEKSARRSARHENMRMACIKADDKGKGSESADLSQQCSGAELRML